MNAKTLISQLIEYGFSKDAATILQKRFPFHSSDDIYYRAIEDTKEEIIKLCENDSDLYDEEDGSYKMCTWDYIEKNYEVLELSNEKFVLICSHKQ
jgi:hypothetical protein